MSDRPALLAAGLGRIAACRAGLGGRLDAAAFRDVNAARIRQASVDAGGS